MLSHDGLRRSLSWRERERERKALGEERHRPHGTRESGREKKKKIKNF